MKLSPLVFALTVTMTAALPAAAQQQTDNTFNWSGKVPAGRWIRVRDLNGSITVGQASGDNVEITATKRWRHGDPSRVRIETQKFGPNDESVVVCALWGERATCDEHGYEGGHEHGMRNNDVSVDFRVLIPKGVRVGASTVNGAVSVDGATSDVDASTVNGDLEVATTGGRANAANVNGRVLVRLGELASDGRMDFATVNGSVLVEFAGESGADIDLTTVNGSVSTDFEMTVQGRLSPKHLRAHIGRPGGPRIRVATINGNVELRKR